MGGRDHRLGGRPPPLELGWVHPYIAVARDACHLSKPQPHTPENTPRNPLQRSPERSPDIPEHPCSDCLKYVVENDLPNRCSSENLRMNCVQRWFRIYKDLPLSFIPEDEEMDFHPDEDES